jgi:hypothetical protein
MCGNRTALFGIRRCKGNRLKIVCVPPINRTRFIAQVLFRKPLQNDPSSGKSHDCQQA